jgi:hypothetical protein
MNRRSALDLLGDIVDAINIHLLRIEALSEPILTGIKTGSSRRRCTPGPAWRETKCKRPGRS